MLYENGKWKNAPLNAHFMSIVRNAHADVLARSKVAKGSAIASLLTRRHALTFQSHITEVRDAEHRNQRVNGVRSESTTSNVSGSLHA